MSFHLAFHARNPADAANHVNTAQNVPNCVKEYLIQAILGIPDDCGVQVTAIGHLFANDYNISTAQISVHPLIWVRSKTDG